MCGRFKFSFLIVFVAITFCFTGAFGARLKDIASIKGIRTNQLIGYGLVIGLNGSGDKGGTSFTIQGLANMLERMGIRVSAEDLKVNNVAAVMVSATLPPFARIGKKIDVTVSSIGDAKSLQGGTLLLAPLKGVDGKIYALAQVRSPPAVSVQAAQPEEGLPRIIPLLGVSAEVRPWSGSLPCPSKAGVN